MYTHTLALIRQLLLPASDGEVVLEACECAKQKHEGSVLSAMWEGVGVGGGVRWRRAGEKKELTSWSPLSHALPSLVAAAAAAIIRVFERRPAAERKSRSCDRGRI